MGVLTAQLTPGLNSRRPLNDEQVGDAALVTSRFQRWKECFPPRSSRRVVVKGVRSAQLVEHRQVLFEALGDAIEEEGLVEAVRSTSALAPLSEIATTIVLSSSPSEARKSSTRPMWWSVWEAKAARTSIMRA